MTISYYDILNIPDDATGQEIKDAYRTLSKQHHPDKEGDREEFESITRAYKVLSDPEKREQYDKLGEDPELYQRHIQNAIKYFEEAAERNPENIGEEILILQKDARNFLNNQIKTFSKEIAKKRNILGKILNNPENDFLREYINNSIDDLETQINNIHQSIDDLGKMIEILNNYIFVAKPKVNYQSGITLDWLHHRDGGWV